MTKKLSENFTKLYSLSETLSFELRPVGKTAEMLEKSKLLGDDFNRDKHYPEVKKKLDEKHKELIERSLHDVSASLKKIDDKELDDSVVDLETRKIKWSVLAELWQKCADAKKEKKSEASKEFDNLKKQLETLQKRYRKLIVDILTTDEDYEKLKQSTPKDFFKANQEDNDFKVFNNFATYFTGFQKNRKNIYSDEAKITAVSNRVVNQNFPKFLSAVKIYGHIKENYPDIIDQVEQELAAILNGKKLDEIFTIDAFSDFVAQSGINFYNNVLGGYTEDGKKYRGINEFINLKRQKTQEATKDKNLALFQLLYKQILSDRETISFVLEPFTQDGQVSDAIRKFMDSVEHFNYDGKETTMEKALSLLLKTLQPEADIYVSADELSNISVKMTGSWNTIKDAITEFGKENFKNKKGRESWEKREQYSLAELCSLKVCKVTEGNETAAVNLLDYWRGNEADKIFKNSKDCADKVSSVLNKYKDAETNELRNNPDDVEKIKNYLDAMQEILHFAKPFAVGLELLGSQSFYAPFEMIYQKLDALIPLYNRVRNYVTKKAAETDKIKLNFGSPTLAAGWDQNKEKDNDAVLFMRDGQYFLGVMNPHKKTDFSKIRHPEPGEPIYCKVIYKLLPGPNKMLPKVFFCEKGQKYYKPSAGLLKNYNDGKHKKGKDFDLVFCHELIDFFKTSIASHPDWRKFGFNFIPTEQYQGMDEFYNEISEQGYNIDFCDIPVSEVDQLVNDDALFLFQIYNKDFAAGAHGRPDKFTLYWKSVFDENNLRDYVFKLSGGAELFLREPSIPRNNLIAHAKGSKLVNRVTKDGQPIPDSLYHEIYNFVNGRGALSADAQKLYDSGTVVVKTATHEIIKDRRYTARKFMFHVPISINFKQLSKVAKFNDKVLKYLSVNPDVKIIGIDRGERNLIYVSLIDQQGNILKQKSFNLVSQTNYQGGNVEFDYWSKLNQREKERDEARKSWKTIDNIKELKAGYLSAVVHEITKMMVENNAIIVMEELNYGFKRGRFAIEKQVYQKFEKALIDKLNYLVFKDVDSMEPGGVLNGYQLTAKFESFEKLGKQTGFIFYIPAAYTSKIDPTTGFTSIFKMKSYKKDSNSKRDFFSHFDSIEYDAEKDAFVFKFNFAKFETSVVSDRDWTVYSATERIVFDPQKREKRINPTQWLKEVFAEGGVDYKNGADLKAYLTQPEPDRKHAGLISEAFFAFEKTLQMRNSSAETKEDFIQSPVLNSTGKFFDSRKVKDGDNLPVDADANGAYHIALKGLYLLENKINGDLNKIDLKIEHADWLTFAENRCK